MAAGLTTRAWLLIWPCGAPIWPLPMPSDRARGHDLRPGAGLCQAGRDQTEAGGVGQHVADRRRVPARSAARGAFAHRLELGGDLLQRALWGCRLDAGDEADQPVAAAPRWRTVEQDRLDDAFGDQAADGAAEALDRPGGVAAPIQHAHDIAPWLIGAHAPHRGQPGLQAGENAIEVGGIAARPDFANRRRVTCAQARIAADAPTGTGGVQAGLGALGDQRAFELSDGAEHLQREHALRGCGVDRIAQAAKMRAAGFELLDDGEQVADRAGEAIEADDGEGFAGADIAQQAAEHGPASIGAGGTLFEHSGAAGGAEFVKLRIGALLFGGDAGVADQPAGGRLLGGFSRHFGRDGWYFGQFYRSTMCL